MRKGIDVVTMCFFMFRHVLETLVLLLLKHPRNIKKTKQGPNIGAKSVQVGSILTLDGVNMPQCMC